MNNGFCPKAFWLQSFIAEGLRKAFENAYGESLDGWTVVVHHVTQRDDGSTQFEVETRKENLCIFDRIILRKP